MKTFLSFALTLTLLIQLSSCETDPDELNDPVNNDTIQKVLLENFSGHLCPHCPDANSIVASAYNLHPDQLVIVTMHTGHFAEPQSSGNFVYDFTTQMGDELFASFGSPAIPTGLVNRSPAPGLSNLTFLPADWQQEVNRHINTASTPDAYIHLDVNFNSTTSTMDINAQTTFLATDTNTRTYNIVLAITEDSILQAQESQNGVLMNYLHLNVLREGITGTEGDLVHIGNITNGDQYSNTYTNVRLDSNWNPQNCNVIAYLYFPDGARKGEVIQAQKTPVM